jgi:hypothetical protein
MLNITPGKTHKTYTTQPESSTPREGSESSRTDDERIYSSKSGPEIDVFGTPTVSMPIMQIQTISDAKYPNN